MKSILMSFSPYWYYLIGEGIKTIECRKVKPQSKDWNGMIECYMTKDEKSFKRIPKKFQKKYCKHLGKVGMRFKCDKIDVFWAYYYDNGSADLTPSRLIGGLGGANDEIAYRRKCCLSHDELFDYIINGKFGYGLHINDLKIYDYPKELYEFRTPCPFKFADKYDCMSGNKCCDYFVVDDEGYFGCCKEITRPPQSWQYVQE